MANSRENVVTTSPNSKLSLLALGLAMASMDWIAADDFFEKRIRPVLVEHCYECHSGRAKKIQGKLRLDSRDAMRNGGETGPAVVPGNVKDSLIVEALRHESLEMPPDEKLPPNIVADFERWIQSGARDPRDTPDVSPDASAIDGSKHWAFQPVRHVEPPSIKNDRIQSAVDCFVISRLSKNKLKMSSAADPTTLVRRAYFDLHGLPPSPEAVEQFQQETIRNPKTAFRNLIDRLLESPRYGERWGRHWLDVARYADNKGYVFFEEKNFPWAWTYRDYVIRAFNEDLPFNRFVMEQLAADQLDLGDDQRALAAMGYLTLGARFMNNTHDIIDDRIDVVTRGLMGLTVTCARCHDHKYDPISQEDYYGLYGVFRSSVQPLVPPEFAPVETTKEYQEFKQGLEQRLKAVDDFVAKHRAMISKAARDRLVEYLLAVHSKRNHPSTENFMLLTENGRLNPAMIHRWERYLKRARRANDPVWTIWHAYSNLSDEDFSQQASVVHEELFESDMQINPLVREMFAKKKPQNMEEVAKEYAQLFSSVGEKLNDDADDAARALWAVLWGANSPAVLPREFSWGFLDLLPDRPAQGEFKKLLKAVETWRVKAGAPPRAMVLVDKQTAYEPVIFIRGNPNREGDSVQRAFPGVLSAQDSKPFQHGSGRRELAERIVDPDNPLTTRVIVNRVWQHHFGRGLVDTPSDFGLRSKPPSHPDLIDWLAKDFVKHNWSMKHLHRVIMNSAVFQQSAVGGQQSAVSSQRSASGNPKLIDSENRWLWRFPRQRLDFEAMRDSMLAVAGVLDEKVGGTPVQLLNGFVPRRTVYGFVNRMDLPSLMRSFDFPEPAATSAGRENTTIAPQALYFMNNDFAVKCATKLLEREDVKSIAEDEQRVAKIYRILFARPPEKEEQDIAAAYLVDSTRAEKWTDFVHALMMTNEFMFVD